jgi:hypothetical protein
MKRYNANQAQPWTNLEMYGKGLGAAVGGSSNTTQPYFQNQTANALSGIAGTLGIGQQLFGGGGGSSGGLLGSLGSMFGGGGATAGLTAADFSAGIGDWAFSCRRQAARLASLAVPVPSAEGGSFPRFHLTFYIFRSPTEGKTTMWFRHVGDLPFTRSGTKATTNNASALWRQRWKTSPAAVAWI